MTHKIYTVITFAPVQGFIEKSRKLRDLYGSSFLLSYLSWVICNAAKSKNCPVVSPALINVTQGMPNQIIIEGDFLETDAKFAFDTAWKCVMESCREWIEENIPGNYYWERNWKLWTKYAWEFFWVQGKPGDSISDVRQLLNEQKYWRDWTGVNWQGESSSLSGADAIAYPGLGRIADPRKYNYQEEKVEIKNFYTQLSQKLGERCINSQESSPLPEDEQPELIKEYGASFVTEKEELSIPELTKRLITHKEIIKKFKEQFKQSFELVFSHTDKFDKEINKLAEQLNPKTFKDLSRLKKKKQIDDGSYKLKQEKYFQGWFQGDGDKAGDFLKDYPDKTKDFSTMMREWGKDFQKIWDKNPQENTPDFCRVIYAGGDDFLGVFYDKKQDGQELKPNYCINKLSNFKTKVWDLNNGKPEKKPITASIGFVWTYPDVPQREVLQHCREAEKSAKSHGRDRIAFRVLFNNGNYLEWVCPWWLLEQELLTSYRDRERKQNWTHIYNDVAVLESRHVFPKKGDENKNDEKISTEIAFGLLEIYFPSQISTIKSEDKWWNSLEKQHSLGIEHERLVGGILGDRKNYTIDNTDDGELNYTKVNKALNNWIINLAKVGFHLCQQ